MHKKAFPIESLFGASCFQSSLRKTLISWLTGALYPRWYPNLCRHSPVFVCDICGTYTEYHYNRAGPWYHYRLEWQANRQTCEPRSRSQGSRSFEPKSLQLWAIRSNNCQLRHALAVKLCMVAISRRVQSKPGVVSVITWQCRGANGSAEKVTGWKERLISRVVQWQKTQMAAELAPQRGRLLPRTTVIIDSSCSATALHLVL